MNNFIYNIPVKVYFGENQLQHLGPEVKNYGTKVLVTYGGGSIKKIGLYDKVMHELKQMGLEVYEFGGIEPNPRIESVNAAIALCKEKDIEVILAVGGGSTIDASKVIGAGVYYDGDAWDLVTRKAPIKNALPLLTILSLSATGSEMDAGGVITKLSTNEKYGIGHESMLPKVSFLDPSVTYSVNAYQTACGSADIISHILELYFNTTEDLRMLDYMMEGLLRTVIDYAPIALKEPTNYEARANLMWASSWAINGFLNGGKRQAWSVHPMEHELSAFYDITHGLGLAQLTPRFLRYCLNDQTVSRYVRFGVEVFGIDKTLDPMEIAEHSIQSLETFFFETLGLQKTFTEIGIDRTHFKAMADKACRGKEIKGFITLKPEDVEKIFEMCL